MIANGSGVWNSRKGVIIIRMVGMEDKKTESLESVKV